MHHDIVKRSLVAALPLAGLLVASAVIAEEEEKVIGEWYPSLEAGFNLTQSAYSDNWNGGDKGSIVWTLIVNGSAENQLNEKVHWNNTLKLAYGQTHQQSVSGGERSWDRPSKSTDLIDYEALFRFTLGAWVDPFVSGRFKSQFQDATDPAGRNISFNPLTFSETAGVAKQFLDEKDRKLMSRVGFAFHQSRRAFFTDAFPATETVSETAHDGGIEWVTDYKTNVLDGEVAWTSNLIVYQPVFFSGDSDLDDIVDDPAAMAVGIPTDVSDYTTEVNISFENIFSTQITKYMSVALYTQWMYDKYDNTVTPVIGDDGEVTAESATAIRTAIRKSGQFKQTLAIGVTYRFL